tara:strand:+ start:296 stop:1714 length:1419 start_codon:yes stop_codon:yes gene_type:complete
MKKHIYFPIEIKVRELMSRLFLSSVFANNDYRIYLGELDDIFQLIKHKKNKGGVFLYNGGLSKQYTNLIKKKCNLNFLIDEELSPMFPNELGNNHVTQEFLNFVMSYRYKKDYIKSLDGVFVWTNQFIKAYRNILNDLRIFVSGNPKMDAWKKKSFPIFKKETIELKKKYKKFILINSDFLFLRQSQIKEEINSSIKILKLYKIKKKNINLLKSLNSIRAIHKLNVFNDLVDFLKNISRKSKGFKIVIRPHPNDNIDYWRESVKNFNNVYVEKPSSDITPYILAAEGIIHNGCSTTLQCISNQKPVAYFVGRYKNYLSKTNINKELIQDNFKIFNKEDYFKWLKIIKNKKGSLNITKYTQFKKKINFPNKHYVSTKIFKIVNKLSKETLKEDRLSPNIYPKKTNIIIFSEYIKKIIFNLLVFLNLKPKKKDKMPNGIKKDEISSILKKIPINNNNLICKQITKNCIEIELIK